MESRDTSHTSSHLSPVKFFFVPCSPPTVIYTCTLSLLQTLLPQTLQILNLLLFGHDLRPVHITCSRPSFASGQGTHWDPSDHLTISSLPSVFRPLLSSLDFTVCHYTNSLVNTLNSFSSLSLQNPDCECTQPPHLGLHCTTWLNIAENKTKQNTGRKTITQLRRNGFT